MKKNRTTHAMSGVFIIVFSLLFLLLAGRFMYIQATGEVAGVSLEQWAKEKRTTSYPLSSERGKIFDKNGMTLAYDMPVYRLYAIISEEYSKGMEEPLHVVDPAATAKALAPILDVDEKDILTPIENGLKNNKFQVEFGKIGKNLSQNKRDEILALNLPGIYFEEDSLRNYPNGTFASHIIGFAREMDVEKEGEVTKEIAGVTGIEREMNDILKGEDGYISYQRDRYNKKLLDADEIVKKPKDGHDVYLTIDQKIQTLLEDVLTDVQEEYNPERITAIVMNPKTGEILAMGNRPSYNPNNPANVENWYNDAISSPFEPGSTMKIFTWASAIEAGVYNGSEGFMSGEYQVNEKIVPIRDHNQGRGWGVISYDEGFTRSSNVAAARLVWEKMGTDTFHEYLQAFDLDKETGIDLPGEIQGQILYNWPREKLTTAFGQGSTLTPIQQMKAATAIANDGKMMQPYVIQKIVDPSTGKVIEEKEPTVVKEPISPETAKEVLQLMDSAVNGKYATGKNYQLEGYTVGGKTGTAQIPDPNGNGYLTGRNNYVFSFLGVAPVEDPELMVYVAVKQPELGDKPSSEPAAKIFKTVMGNSLRYLNIEPDMEEEKNVELVTVPDLKGQNPSEAKQRLSDLGLNPVVIGDGNKIIAASVDAGEEVLSQKRVFLVTDNPKMPNIIGWSVRDVVQLADLMELKMEVLGGGYAISQSIEAGTALKKNDYLGVEFAEPNIENKETNEEAENNVDHESG